jgi:hypothetical protein
MIIRKERTIYESYESCKDDERVLTDLLSNLVNDDSGHGSTSPTSQKLFANRGIGIARPKQVTL